MNIDASKLEELLLVAPDEEREQLLAVVTELNARRDRERAQREFIFFVEKMWPDFISGAHHRRIAKLFEDVVSGKKKRLIINLAPRHSKSEFSSYLLVAWFLGRFPKEKVIQVSNTSELAEGFGRKVRNLLASDEYRAIFPDVSLRADSKAAGRWNTNKNGEYYATGVNGALAGRGGTLFLIDDPHTEEEALQARFHPGVYDRTYQWFKQGPLQRLQPDGKIVLIMTRWSQADLTGRILEDAARNKEEGADQWEVVEFPAILPSGRPLWPEFWSIEELLAKKASLDNYMWQAQYQQNPTSDETAIIGRGQWQVWEKEKPPETDFIIMAVDTACLAKTTADYSAIVLFGVFQNEGDGNSHVILLEAWRGRVEFPELKQKLLELWKEFSPDATIIERIGSGTPLVQEFRRMGIPVQEFIPSKGNDKIARLNGVVDLFASERVWAPARRWAEELIDEVASFPFGRNDDFVDATSCALTYFRNGGFVRAKSDYEDDEDFRPRRAAYY